MNMIRHNYPGEIASQALRGHGVQSSGTNSGDFGIVKQGNAIKGDGGYQINVPGLRPTAFAQVFGVVPRGNIIHYSRLALKAQPFAHRSPPRKHPTIVGADLSAKDDATKPIGSANIVRRYSAMAFADKSAPTRATGLIAGANSFAKVECGHSRIQQ